jgi:cell division protein FtsZ
MNIIQHTTPLENTSTSGPRIVVLGLGGAGCNTIARLCSLRIPGVELIAANTDRQCLNANPAQNKILLGADLTRGLGSGGNPQTGQAAAEQSYHELISAMRGCDLLFLTAGMGGGTGSGAIEIAARIAKSLDIPSMSFVTVPFTFEAGRRQQNALEAIARLRPFTDTLVTIPNDRLISLAGMDAPLQTAFGLSDDILIRGIQGLSEMLGTPGLLDVDFSHILRLIKNGGGTFISIGSGKGEARAIHAIEAALSHPLLEDVQIQHAQGMIVKFSGSITINEVQEAMRYLQSRTDPDAEIIPALDVQERNDDEVMVTLLATGIGATAIEYAPGMVEIPAHDAAPQLDPQIASLPLDFSAHSFDSADKDMEDLEVPAFIRRGYNQLEHTALRNG